MIVDGVKKARCRYKAGMYDSCLLCYSTVISVIESYEKEQGHTLTSQAKLKWAA